MYDYPLEPDWSTEEIIEVVGLYNAVEPVSYTHLTLPTILRV